ncbi:MAG: PAS domain S-box protein [Firmicutes bacterium]|nr:PAS domain S-box protein [Bacillota bacterium]
MGCSGKITRSNVRKFCNPEGLELSEEKYRSLIENSHDIIYTLNLEGVFTFVSPSWTALLGHPLNQVVGKPFQKFVHPNDIERCKAFLLRVIETGQRQTGVEYRVLHLDGSWHWHTTNAMPLWDESGLIIGGQGNACDITTRKQSEEALQQSEEKYRLLLAQMPQGLAVHEVIWDESGKAIDYRFLDINPSFEKLTGLKREDILGRTVLEIMPETEKYWIEKYGHVALTGESLMYENYSQELGRYFRVVAYSPQTGQFAVIISDISENKQMEEELRSSEEKYRSIFENISEGVYQISPQGRFINVNPAIVKIFGFTSTEEMMDSIYDVRHQLYVNPDDRVKLLEQLADHDHYSFETEMFHKDGRKIWMSFNVRAVRDEQGDLQHIEGTCRDISERKHSETLVKAAQQQMEQVIELLPDATSVINQGGQVVFWNKAMEEMTGVSKEQMVGHGDYEYTIPFYGERRPALIDLALRPNSEYGHIVEKYDFIRQEGDTLLGEIYVPNACQGKGAYYWGAASKLVDLDGQIIGAIQSVRDITERKQLEKARSEAAAIQKMTLLSIGDGVISTDNEGKINLFNQVAEQLTGWSKEEAFGRPIEEIFDVVDDFTREKPRNPVREVLRVGKSVETVNHTILISKDGIERPIEDNAAPIIDEAGLINGVVLVFRDFTEQKERQEKIAYLSYHDYLTGLYNRRFFEEELKRLDTERNLPITLIMGDINGLKLANDAFGHLVGDKLLRNVAEIMKKECRTDDIIARIGGDEFMFLLPKTAAQEAEIIIERINRALAKVKVDSIILSVSFGWATKRSAAEPVSKVTKQAEDLMYRHKLTESSSMGSKTIKVIMSTLYEKNKREEQHSQRVSELCASIGTAMDISAEDIAELRTGGLLHDIGKIALDETVLNKPGTLDESEWFEIKRHSETGYRILSSVNEFSHLADYVLAHHERWDGNGYPNGLKGSEIPMQARIMALADAYDAMTSDRPYREALSGDMVAAEIKKHAGTQFDPAIARIFIEQVLKARW